MGSHHPRNGLRSPDVRPIPVFIYGLREPGGPTRYVGKTSDIGSRISSHRSRTGAPRVRDWIRSLEKRGLRVEAHVLHEVPPGVDGTPLEAYFIALHSRLGPMLNRQGVERAPKPLIFKVPTRRPRHCRYCGSPDHMGSSFRPRCEPARRDAERTSPRKAA